MTIRWLHLSDTHFREDELWDRRATLRALITKVSELKSKGLAPDMVFVTGDIAWSGKPKEYEQATRFFHELNKVLELDPKDRWFLVPGNHDVDRSRIKAAHRAITKSLQDEATVEELLLHDPDSLRSLSTRLEAYYNFAAEFLGPARAVQPDRPWRTDVREFDGVSVGILQLNSAWISEGGEADNANLLIGEPQVREALDATAHAFLRIALMHHPLRNLRDFDENRVESLLGMKGGAAFLLRGHLHLNRTKMQSSPDGEVFELAAGTLYTEEKDWPRGFHLGEVDLDKGEARLHLFRHSNEGRGFFAPDNLTYENAPNGSYKFRLPAAYRVRGKKPKPEKDLSEDQRLSFTARYRNAAANYHGHARFIGFPNQGPRPNAMVNDLFVPLRMKTREGTGEAQSHTTLEIAQRLLCRHQEAPARIVVLGDPGSGKTTLSRFLVMLAAGAITLPGLDVTGEPLPFRIAFRDFAEMHRENPTLSLLDYLEIQAKRELSLTLPKNFLKNAIEKGHAVLFLDGLDEVGSAEHRVSMRDVVASFSAAHGNLPMLITSRIAGYDDAPLSGQTIAVEKRPVLVIFYHLVLEKFDDADLRAFVEHWYAVQEPSDPVARDHGITALLAAMEADERVRELARSPILATLIAMIHRVEASLPGERAKLYELCVRMLLVTWPAQAKRPFAEIDPGLQRAYLESLAYGMQATRDRSGQAVAIPHKTLVRMLLPVLRKRDHANDPEEKIIGIVERWIEHLERQTGILVQQSPGVFAFFHLSIMEYLAAQGLEREQGRDKAVATIAKYFIDPLWREVCLLAVGSHADDGTFLDAVYAKVEAADDIRRSDFLLRCLREEAHFRPDQREAILKSYAAILLARGPWFTDRTLADQIQRFSVRHGAAVREWIENRLDHAVGDELLETVLLAIRPDTSKVATRLAKRDDRSVVVGAVLEFWPASALGNWAAREADAPGALRWSISAPYELTTLRGVKAIRHVSRILTASTLLALNQRTVQSAAQGADNIARLAKKSRPGGRGLPAFLEAKAGHEILITTPRMPRKIRLAPGTSFRRAAGYARHYAQQAAAGIGSDLADTVSDVRVHAFARDFARHMACDFISYFFGSPEAFGVDFASYFGEEHVSQFAREFATDVARYFGAYLAGGVAGNFTGTFTDTEPGDGQSPIRAFTAGGGEDWQRAAEALMVKVAGEAWIALATTTSHAAIDQRRNYGMFRLQNRWLFEIWSAVDKRLPENPTPAQLALYFALGWAQSTTTWAWPDSERWRTLFAAGPGEHWLVRSQWHLCKLTDDPSSKEDDAGLRAALRDGLGDESLPGYAARLSEVLGIEA